ILSDYAKIMGISIKTAQQYVWLGKLETVKVNHRHYVSKDLIEPKLIADVVWSKYDPRSRGIADHIKMPTVKPLADKLAKDMTVREVIVLGMAMANHMGDFDATSDVMVKNTIDDTTALLNALEQQ